METVIATLSSFKAEEIRKVLELDNTADAPKLHAMANEIMKILIAQGDSFVGSNGAIVGTIFSIAAYLEARAAYLEAHGAREAVIVAS